VRTDPFQLAPKIGGDIEKDFSALSECVKKYGAVK